MTPHFPDHIQDLATWRAHLFRRQVEIIIPVVLLLLVFATGIDVVNQYWRMAATCIGAMMWFGYIYFARHGNTEWLVVQLILIMYIIGLGLLSTFGNVVQVHFLAPPILAVIFISNRAAFVCSTVNAVILLAVGFAIKVDAGLPVLTEHPNPRFFITTVSFIIISGMLTWSCGMVLDGAKRFLQAQVESSKAFELLALQDPLTQLANRRMLQQGLAQEIARSKRSGRPFAIALIDLDRFKEINDTHGHDAGDELLKAVAARIRQFVRTGDMVVRLGGDEFVVLFHNYEGEAAFQNVLMRLLNKTSGEYMVNERVLTVGVSVGAAVYPHDGEDQQELLKNADIALYRAKAAGRNSYRFFSDAGETLYGVPQSAGV